MYSYLQEGKKQMPVKDLDISRQIAHFRIHVEHVTDRLKKFKILNTTTPITQVDLTETSLLALLGLSI